MIHDTQLDHKIPDSTSTCAPTTEETPLLAEVSPEVSNEVSAFMEQAAAQNAAAAEEIPITKEHKIGAFISFDHVSKSFGAVDVLKDVSFCVLPGETLCILGRSGVGKSVSLQMLLGFLKPDSGKVYVAGEDITGLKEKQLLAIRRKVTMVFQNGALFDSITVGENVAFPLRERGDMEEDQIIQVVNGLLEMVGVAGMADLLPQRSFDRHEAVGRHRPRAGRAARGSALRRAYNDGGPFDGASARQPD